MHTIILPEARKLLTVDNTVSPSGSRGASHVLLVWGVSRLFVEVSTFLCTPP